jgi:predicted dehydrogenase
VTALQKARELVTSGAIGDVRHVEASYLQSWLAAKNWGDWRTESKLCRLSKSHGSHGVLGDIGIHILDFASYGAASAIDNVTCLLKALPKAPERPDRRMHPRHERLFRDGYRIRRRRSRYSPR